MAEKTTVHSRFSRAVGVWLALFVIFICVLTAGVLLAERQVTEYKSQLAKTIQERLGIRFSFSTLSFSLTEGLRIESPLFDYSLGKPALHGTFTAPAAYIRFNLLDVLSGRFTLERIVLDSPTLSIDCQGLTLQELAATLEAKRTPTFFFPMESLQIKQGTFRLQNLQQIPTISVGEIDMSASRNEDNDGARIAAKGSLDIPGKPNISIELDSQQTTKLRSSFKIDQLTKDSLAYFYAGINQYVAEGATSFLVRAEKEPPDTSLRISWECSFQNVQIANNMYVASPLNGVFSGEALLETPEKLFTIKEARLRTNDLDCQIKGTVSISQPPPEFNLSGEIVKMPAELLLSPLLDRYLGKYGKCDIVLDNPGRILLTLQGVPPQMRFSAEVQQSLARVSFAPSEANIPNVDTSISVNQVRWNYPEGTILGSGSITSGTFNLPKFKISGKNLSALVRLEDRKVYLDSITCEMNQSNLNGVVSYDWVEKKGHAVLHALVSKIEQTALSTSIKNVLLSGGCAVSADISFEPSVVTANLDIDASQTELTYRWWYRKPPGIGVKSRVEATWYPRKSCTFKGSLEGLNTEGRFESELSYKSGRYRLMRTTAAFDRLDVTTVGKCLRIPYEVRGGTASNGTYEWLRDNDPKTDETPQWHASVNCEIDEISVKSTNATEPMRANQTKIEVSYRNALENTADIKLEAETCVMPPFGTSWFTPIEIPSEFQQIYKPEERSYTYKLACRFVSVPPWEGSDFQGSAFFSRKEAGFNSYSAKVGEGNIEGKYVKNRIDNTVESYARWNSVPATYLIKHLHMPELLKGTITGDVEYTVDTDDPSTLRGKSKFEVTPGNFSADFLLFELGLSRFGEITSPLPPTLTFDKLSVETEFERDLIRTPKIRLVSPGIDISAQGQFVIRGDMEYDLVVSLSPEVADKIPALNQYLNIEGHRIAGQNIDLGFKITGPTYKPHGELSEGPPVSVTLVTGGLGVVSEAVKVIDLPRKMLLDLLRIGGGILGPSNRTK